MATTIVGDIMNNDKHQRMLELRKALENDYETAEKDEAMFLEFAQLAKELDPGRYYSDYMTQLEEGITIKRHAEALAEQLSEMPRKEALVAIVSSIIDMEADEQKFDVVEVDARYYLLKKWAVHPNADEVVGSREPGESAEKTVDKILSYQPIILR